MRRADAARVALSAALVLSAAGCGRAPGESDRRNVVLITLDTTRADRIGCYGSRRVRTPSIDSVAAGGTVFERAFTPAPITAPAHASILSGTFPPFHQVRDNDVDRVPKGLPWLPSLLKERGYRTAAMVAAFPLRAGAGFSRGFDHYGDHLEAPQGSLGVTNVHAVGVASRRGDRVSQEFRLWLEKNGRGGPFFVWLHYYDPHFPYEPPKGYATLDRANPYDGEVAFLDDCIGTVLRGLREEGLERSTGVVVVADHGEGLGDHGEKTHGLLLYNPTMQVPLVMRFPWLGEQPPRVGTVVSSADVAPTVLDALGFLRDPSLVQARSLLPLLRREPSAAAGFARRPLYFETFYGFHHYGWSPLTGFLLGSRKYIHAPKDELYDVDRDMAEAHDLAGTADAAAMATRLPSFMAELRNGRPAGSRREPTREEIAKLRSLGYMGGTSAKGEEALDRVAELPYAKDRMDAYHQHNEVLGLAMKGKFREALDRSAAAMAADPRNKTARASYATYAARLGLRDVADEAWLGIMKDFSDKDVLFSAGSYFLGRDDVVHARQCFEALAVEDPEDVEVLTRLGDVATKEGDHRRALERYRQALAQDAEFREALLGEAVSMARVGEPGAEQRLAAVAARFPFDPQVAFNYGVHLMKNGRPVQGEEHLRRAAVFSEGPLWMRTQLLLASFYRDHGRVPEARACLREVEMRTKSPEVLAEAREMLSEIETLR